MRRMLGTIAWADVAVLADVAGDHPPGQAGPSCIRMDVMFGTHARQAWMLAAASSRSARDDTADRAELHPRGAGDLATRLTLVTLDCGLVDIVTSVGRVDAAVYSPLVLRPQRQGPRDAVVRVSGACLMRCAARPPLWAWRSNSGRKRPLRIRGPGIPGRGHVPSQPDDDQELVVQPRVRRQAKDVEEKETHRGDDADPA